MTVVFPPGYTIELARTLIGEPTTDADGRTTYKRPARGAAEFFAYFVADRPSAFAEATRTVAVDGRDLDVSIRAWPDDPAWAERGPAVLLDKRHAGAVRVDRAAVGRRPAVRRGRGREPSPARGYAGRYDPATAPIEIAYYAESVRHPPRGGPCLVRRQPAGGPLGERGLRDSWYAIDAAVKHRREGRRRPGLTPEQRPRRSRSMRGGRSGRDDGREEDYGYAASAELARLIAERAGPTGLASVWQAARDGTGAYQPAGLEPIAGTMPGSAGRPERGDRLRRRRDRSWARHHRTGEACSTCSRTGPARSTTTCGERGSSATRRPPCSTCGPRPAASTTRSSRGPASGSCRRSSGRRCAPGSSMQATELIAAAEPRARRPRRVIAAEARRGPDGPARARGQRSRATAGLPPRRPRPRPS